MISSFISIHLVCMLARVAFFIRLWVLSTFSQDHVGNFRGTQSRGRVDIKLIEIEGFFSDSGVVHLWTSSKCFLFPLYLN